jgi:hypothetical protein
VTGGQPLHHDREDVADAALGVALGLLLDRSHAPGRLVPDLVLELLQQERLGLGRRQARGALERADRLVPHLVDLRLAGGHPALTFGDVDLALLELLLAREQTLLERGDLPRRASRAVALFGVRRRRSRLRPGARGAELRRARGQDSGRDHQSGREPQGHDDRRDHSFHCVPLPFATARGRRREFSHCPWNAAGRTVPGSKREMSRKATVRPPRQMAAVMRCWVGSAGRARPDAARDRSLGWFVVAVVTEAAASAGKC